MHCVVTTMLVSNYQILFMNACMLYTCRACSIRAVHALYVPCMLKTCCVCSRRAVHAHAHVVHAQDVVCMLGLCCASSSRAVHAQNVASRRCGEKFIDLSFIATNIDK